MKKKQTSEFGKGFVYNLILFAEHFSRIKSYVEMDNSFKNKTLKIGIGMWFNGSSDHLYEFEIPEQFKKTKIGKLAKELRETALEIGHGKRMLENNIKMIEFDKIVRLTKDLGMEIDKKLGIKPIKGEWE